MEKPITTLLLDGDKQMLTLEELKQKPIQGNAANDQPLLNEIDVFIMSPKTDMEEKIKAIELINKIMGCPTDKVTEDDVIEYQKISNS